MFNLGFVVRVSGFIRHWCLVIRLFCRALRAWPAQRATIRLQQTLPVEPTSRLRSPLLASIERIHERFEWQQSGRVGERRIR